jgi:hypothetical protein
LNKKVWVVFKNGEYAPKWTRRGFGHVCILSKDEYQYYMLDPAWTRFDVHILPVRAEDKFEYTLGDQYTVVEYNRSDNYHFSYCSFTLMTCVEVVKYALGIKKFFIRTPYQLYKYLLKHNGVIVKGGK